MPGRFITLEGGEGAGKSTQIKLLCDGLNAIGQSAVMTREPGGAPGAEAIRALLVTGDTPWEADCEALLHTAARVEHLAKTVKPALARGDWVISDRYADSTLAYQGYGHGVDMGRLNALYAWAFGDFRPDLTLILDLPVEEGLARAQTRGGGEDRYEQMGRDFHERLRQGFLSIAEAEPDRCVVLNAAQEVDALQADIRATVSARLGALFS